MNSNAKARPAGLEPATSGLEIGRRFRPKPNVPKELRKRSTIAVLPVVLDYFPLIAWIFRDLHRIACFGDIYELANEYRFQRIRTF